MAAKNIIVPTLGESITEGKIVKLLKNIGEYIEKDEIFAELETDKVTIEIPSNFSGTIRSLHFKLNDTVLVGAVLCEIEEGANTNTPVDKETERSEASTAASKDTEISSANNHQNPHGEQKLGSLKIAPSAKVLLENSMKYNIDLSKISPTGNKGHIVKSDVQKAIDDTQNSTTVKHNISNQEQEKQLDNQINLELAHTNAPQEENSNSQKPYQEEVKMTRLRQTIAQRLKSSQEINASLTTFNEIDMTNLIALRAKFKDKIEKKYGTKLGFMSFFTKAAIASLQEIKVINASVENDTIIYKKYYNIGIAVGTENGLVVPTIRGADNKSLLEIEAEILNFAKKAKDGKLTMHDLSDGTFTITNGGIYGSLLSTPIINPPQSAILGLHNIQKRAVVISDEIKIRDMMYVALSYDHRIIDGKEAVTFLKRIKEIIEDPLELLLTK